MQRSSSNNSGVRLMTAHSAKSGDIMVARTGGGAQKNSMIRSNSQNGQRAGGKYRQLISPRSGTQQSKGTYQYDQK